MQTDDKLVASQPGFGLSTLARVFTTNVLDFLFASQAIHWITWNYEWKNTLTEIKITAYFIRALWD